MANTFFGLTIGASGLYASNISINTTAHNISNVNTIGFKGSSVTFSDVLHQTTSAATGPDAETGRTGMNAMQIGIGVGLFRRLKR